MSDRTLSPLWRIGRVVAVVVVVLVALLWLVSKVPNLNPFATETKDRSGPALLQSVRDLSQFHGAEGNFQVIVDLEHDVAWVPDVIAGVTRCSSRVARSMPTSTWRRCPTRR